MPYTENSQKSFVPNKGRVALAVRALQIVFALVLFQCLVPTSTAGAVFLDFEEMMDGELVSNQYAGLTFSSTVVLSAGVSLNEFEVPPRSGTSAFVHVHAR